MERLSLLHAGGGESVECVAQVVVVPLQVDLPLLNIRRGLCVEEEGAITKLPPRRSKGAMHPVRAANHPHSLLDR
jgi:hypothetical protein